MIHQPRPGHGARRRLRLAAATVLFTIAAGVLIAGAAIAIVGKVDSSTVLGVLAGIAISACLAFGREQLHAYRDEIAMENVRQIVADEDSEEVAELLRAFSPPRVCLVREEQPTPPADKDF